MLGHVRGQDHVNDALADQLVRVPVQVLEDVDPVVGHGQFKAQTCVVVLKDRDVIVEGRQLGVGVAQEGAGKG